MYISTRQTHPQWQRWLFSIQNRNSSWQLIYRDSSYRANPLISYSKSEGQPCTWLFKEYCESYHKPSNLNPINYNLFRINLPTNRHKLSWFIPNTSPYWHIWSYFNYPFPRTCQLIIITHSDSHLHRGFYWKNNTNGIINSYVEYRVPHTWYVCLVLLNYVNSDDSATPN